MIRSKETAISRRNRMVRRLFGLFIMLLGAVLAYSTYRLATILRTEKESASYYAALRGDHGQQPTQTASQYAAGGDGAVPQTPPEGASEPAALSGLNFDVLRAINPDVVGWLTCEGTVIDYPLVQAEDNAYYLTRLFSGEENKAGTLFLDCCNAQDFTDDNSVVYGHHMKNGSMLAGIVQYRAQAYYDAHTAFRLYTPQGDYLVELFSGYVAQDEAVVTAPHFVDDAAFMEFIADAKAASTFQTETEVLPSDRILTLVTCTYEVRNARYVLHGKLSPIGLD